MRDSIRSIASRGQWITMSVTHGATAHVSTLLGGSAFDIRFLAGASVASLVFAYLAGPESDSTDE